MKHVKSMSKPTLPAAATTELVCGYLIIPGWTKCVEDDSFLAPLLKENPEPLR